MLNIAIINGGRGAATLIPALLARQGLHVTSIVNAYDDGKSTGIIRHIFSMLGPSDIRKVQELMLPVDDPDHDVHRHWFRYRYATPADRTAVLGDLADFASGQRDNLVGAISNNQAVVAGLRRFLGEFLQGLRLNEAVCGQQLDFADCSIMNCIYAGAFLAYRRNMEQATLAIDRLFRLRGLVLPTSIEDKTLVALRENGEVLYSEAEIVELRSNVRIERVYLLDRAPRREHFEALSIADRRAWLERHDCFVSVSPGVDRALRQADIIIYAPGTQHSSLYPTYLATGLGRAIADNTNAFKVYVTNIGADYETPTYCSSDYLRGALRYLRLGDHRNLSPRELFDMVLINTGRRKADDTYVIDDEDNFGDLPVPRVLGDFETALMPGHHDGSKVVGEILQRYQADQALGRSQ